MGNSGSIALMTTLAAWSTVNYNVYLSPTNITHIAAIVNGATFYFNIAGDYLFTSDNVTFYNSTGTNGVLDGSCMVSGSGHGCNTSGFVLNGQPNTIETITGDWINSNGGIDHTQVFPFLVLPLVPSQAPPPAFNSPATGNLPAPITLQTSQYSSEYGSGYAMQGCILIASPSGMTFSASAAFPTTFSGYTPAAAPLHSLAFPAPQYPQNSLFTVSSANLSLSSTTLYDYHWSCYNSAGGSGDAVTFTTYPNGTNPNNVLFYFGYAMVGSGSGTTSGQPWWVCTSGLFTTLPNPGVTGSYLVQSVIGTRSVLDNLGLHTQPIISLSWLGGADNLLTTTYPYLDSNCLGLLYSPIAYYPAGISNENANQGEITLCNNLGNPSEYYPNTGPNGSPPFGITLSLTAPVTLWSSYCASNSSAAGFVPYTTPVYFYYATTTSSTGSSVCGYGTLNCTVLSPTLSYACNNILGGNHIYYPSATAGSTVSAWVGWGSSCNSPGDGLIPLDGSGLSLLYGSAASCINLYLSGSTVRVSPDEVNGAVTWQYSSLSSSSISSCPAPVVVPLSYSTVNFMYTINGTAGIVCGVGTLNCTVQGSNYYTCNTLLNGQHYQQLTGATVATSTAITSINTCYTYGDSNLPLDYAGISFTFATSACVNLYLSGSTIRSNYAVVSGTTTFNYRASTTPYTCSNTVRLVSSSSGGSSGSTSSSSSSGLSGGAIAGIVIGSVVGALIICSVCFFIGASAGFRTGKKHAVEGPVTDNVVPHSTTSETGAVEMSNPA